MPIPSADLALLRTAGPHRVRPYFATWELNEIASATLSDSAFAYPLGQLTVSGTSDWSDIEVGMMYRVHDGSDLVTEGVVRKEPTSSILHIDGKSLGDPGVAKNIAYGFAQNQTVTIYDTRSIWTLLSRIVNKVFYKKFDEPYVDQGSRPDPVCNLGSWRWAFVDPVLNIATFNFDASGSYAWFGKSISSYAYTLPASAVVTGGGVNTSVVTFTLPPGRHLVECLVTDENGKTATGIRPVWVFTRSGANAPLSADYAATIGNARQDLTGRTMLASFSGLLPNSAMYLGAPVIYFEEATYNGSELSTGIGVDTFCGFITTDTRRITRDKRTHEIEIKSPAHLLTLIPMVSQAIIEKVNPARWTEVAWGYSDPNFVIWYILSHHVPNQLALFDYNKLTEADPPRKKRWGLAGSTVGEQISEVAGMIGGNIGSASDGSLYLRRDPMLENNTFRNAMDVRMTIGETDVGERVEAPYNYLVPVGQFHLYGFTVDSSERTQALASAAPGRHQGHGPGRIQGTTYLVASQDELNVKSGHLWQKQNREIPELNLKMMRNFDVFDPAKHYNAWWNLGISEHGITYDQRTLVTEVMRTWKDTPNGNKVKNVEITVSVESFGQQGVTMPVNRGGAGAWPWTPVIYPPERIDNSGFYQSFATAFNDQGELNDTFGLSEIDPNWYSVLGDIEGIVNDLVFDPFSPLFLSGFLEGAIRAYAVSIITDTLYIWKCEDIIAVNPVWTELDSFTMDDSTPSTSARIVISDTTQNTICAAYRTQSGTYITSTTDEITWATPSKVDTSGADDTTNDDAPIGMAMSGTNVVITARTAAAKYELFRIPAPEDSPILVGSTPVSPGTIHPFCPIVLDGDDLYTAMRDTSGSSSNDTEYDFGDVAAEPWIDESTLLEYDDASSWNTQRYLQIWTQSSSSVIPDPMKIQWDFKQGCSAVNNLDWAVALDKYGDSTLLGTPGPGPDIDWEVKVVTSNNEEFEDSGTLTWSTDTSVNSIGGGCYVRHMAVDMMDNLASDLDGIVVKYVQCTITFQDPVPNDYSNYCPTHLDMWEFAIAEPELTFTAWTYPNNRLYLVTDYATSPTWNNRTPSSGLIPVYPNGLKLDPVNSYIVLIAGNADTPLTDPPKGEISYSEDRGSSWSLQQIGRPYTGIAMSDVFAILYGHGLMDYTDDYGQTSDDSILGNFAQIGAVGRIAGVKAIL